MNNKIEQILIEAIIGSLLFTTVVTGLAYLIFIILH